MKIALLYIVILAGILGAVIAIGRGPSLSRWGEPGVRSLYAAAAICGVGGLLAVLPLPIVSALAPANVGFAVFAGTTVRLLVTLPLMLAYQALADVHLPSFLLWMLVLYLLLLVAETTVGVMVVRRAYSPAERDAR